MPASPEPLKAIIAAGSGYGKTGALWSLAAAGFNLKIFDSDRGTNILRSALRDNPAALSRVQVESFTNRLRGNKAGFLVGKGSPDAWPRALGALDKFPQGGSIYDWGPDTVVVIDSLSMFGRQALLYAMHVDSKSGRQPEIQHYGYAMSQLEGMMALLYGDDVQCHVLILTHVSIERTKEGEFIGAFPMSLGKANNDVIPRYVNNVLTIKLSGLGPKAKRYLSTRPTSNQMATKIEELASKEEYLLTDGVIPKPGLAEFFHDCGWPAINGASK